MKTCPKCGAENLATSASCRMCAMPLEAGESRLGARADIPLAEKIPSPILVSGREPARQHAPSSSYGGHLVCQACQAVNEPDYVFCEQCGARLTRPSRVTAERPSEMAPGPAAPAALKNSPEPSVPRRNDVKPSVERPAVSAASKVDLIQSRRSSERVQSPPRKAAVVESISPAPERVSCDHCGNTQPPGGLYCGICGSVLTPTTTGYNKGRKKEGPLLELITDNNEERETYKVTDEVVLGRIEGDVTFSHDGYMSSRHARIIERNGRYYLSDEGSRNGTFIRIKEEVEIQDGDVFLVGKQVLKFNKKD